MFSNGRLLLPLPSGGKDNEGTKINFYKGPEGATLISNLARKIPWVNRTPRIGPENLKCGMSGMIMRDAETARPRACFVVVKHAVFVRWPPSFLTV